MRPKHVLIVDDDPMILEVMAQALSPLGVQVSIARRVSIARDLLMRQPVDLVIADARMPGESGIELAKAAKDRGIASIVMSGDREWTLDHGIPDGHYLAKPFDLQHLRRLVAALLEGDGPIEIGPI